MCAIPPELTSQKISITSMISLNVSILLKAKLKRLEVNKKRTINKIRLETGVVSLNKMFIGEGNDYYYFRKIKSERLPKTNQMFIKDLFPSSEYFRESHSIETFWAFQDVETQNFETRYNKKVKKH